MCIVGAFRKKIPKNFRKSLTHFNYQFYILYDTFGLNMTLKIHVIFYHYKDYFVATGVNFKTTSAW